MVNEKFLDEILETLCKFPHRYSTTDEEREAAAYLKDKLEELGLNPELEAFRSQTTFSSIYAIIYGGFFIAIILHYFAPFFGLIIMLAMAVIFYGEQTCAFSPLSRIVPQGDSQNVLARIPAEFRTRVSLVLVAHYDTSKTSLAFAPASVRFLRPLYLVSLFLIASAIAVMALRLIPGLAGRSWFGAYLAVPAIYLFYMTLLMFERDLRGRFVNGAADNATGVAAVMELSRWLKHRGGIKDRDVWILFTGCEEVGLAGMTAFLEKHADDLDRNQTVFINFDNLGGGKLCYITSEGMLYRLRADAELLSHAQALGREDAFRDVSGREFNALTLDTLVPHSRGYRVIALMGLNQYGVPYPWHWFNDTLENVDRKVMYEAAAFGKALIQKFAGIKSEGSGGDD
jgi:hypothetical protein